MSTLSRQIWRVRVVKIDAFDDFEFEWYNDLLYRNRKGTPVEISEFWRVDIVAVADGIVKRSIRSCIDRGEAESLAQSVTTDLNELSIAQFMENYIISN